MRSIGVGVAAAGGNWKVALTSPFTPTPEPLVALALPTLPSRGRVGSLSRHSRVAPGPESNHGRTVTPSRQPQNGAQPELSMKR